MTSYPAVGRIIMQAVECYNSLLSFVASCSKVTIYGSLFLICVACASVIFVGRSEAFVEIRAGTLDFEKPPTRKASNFNAPERAPGKWVPVDFQRPPARPYPDWDVHKTEPLPYRPFKYGTYHITMGLRSMHWDEWIELDNHFPKYHADKARRIKERGTKCCKTAPEAFDGAIELLEEL